MQVNSKGGGYIVHIILQSPEPMRIPKLKLMHRNNGSKQFLKIALYPVSLQKRLGMHEAISEER